MEQASKKTIRDFRHSRWGYFITGFVALVVAYTIASRAIETGSLQQYTLAILLLVVTVNRSIKAFRKS